MSWIAYISHPEVVIDPHVPVPEWHLNAEGNARMGALCEQPWITAVHAILSSDETKALDTANHIAKVTGAPITVDKRTAETDRSATGFLPQADHDRLRDLLFNQPESSAEGWERAVDLQARVVAGVSAFRKADWQGNGVICGHGGAGAMLLCALKSMPITLEADPMMPGAAFVFDRATGEVMHPWMPMERLGEVL